MRVLLKIEGRFVRWIMSLVMPLLVCLLVSPSAQANPVGCFFRLAARVLTARTRGPRMPIYEQRSRPPQNYHELMQAFRENFVANLDKEDQRLAFDVYLATHFGGGNVGTVHQIAEALKKYPETAKTPFRSMHVERPRYRYPIVKGLKILAKKHRTHVQRVRERVTDEKIAAKYWKEIFADPSTQKGSFNYDKSFNTLGSDIEIKSLFTQLLEIYRDPPPSGVNRAKLAQAIVDVAYMYGYADPVADTGLRAKSGRAVIQGIKDGLVIIDKFLEKKGFEHGLDGLLREMGVEGPGELPSLLHLSQLIVSLEKEVLDNTERVVGEENAYTIRHLSLIESVFRGCLGGDCSTSSYPLLALDPSFHYFTLTSPNGKSRGHVTVVLGHTGMGTKKTRTAFVDKIQNIPHEELPFVLEGIRRSVAEQGYELSLPKDLGDHNGISNLASTPLFIASEVGAYRDQKQARHAFRPYRSEYKFKNAYSRAYARHSVKPLLSFELPGEVEMTSGEVPVPWKAKKFKIKTILENTYALKRGSPDDQISYIEAMEGLRVARTLGDPEFESQLQTWIAETSTPWQVRKRAMEHYLVFDSGKVPSLLDHFEIPQRVDLVQNWIQTPRFESTINGSALNLISHIMGHRSARKLIPRLLGKIKSYRLLDFYFRFRLTEDPYIKPKVEELLDLQWEGEPIERDGIIEIMKAMERTKEQWDTSGATAWENYLGSKSIAPADKILVLKTMVELNDMSVPEGTHKGIAAIPELQAREIAEAVYDPFYFPFHFERWYPLVAQLPEKWGHILPAANKFPLKEIIADPNWYQRKPMVQVAAAYGRGQPIPYPVLKEIALRDWSKLKELHPKAASKMALTLEHSMANHFSPEEKLDFLSALKSLQNPLFERMYLAAQKTASAESSEKMASELGKEAPDCTRCSKVAQVESYQTAYLEYNFPKLPDGTAILLQETYHKEKGELKEIHWVKDGQIIHRLPAPKDISELDIHVNSQGMVVFRNNSTVYVAKDGKILAKRRMVLFPGFSGDPPGPFALSNVDEVHWVTPELLLVSFRAGNEKFGTKFYHFKKGLLGYKIRPKSWFVHPNPGGSQIGVGADGHTMIGDHNRSQIFQNGKLVTRSDITRPDRITALKDGSFISHGFYGDTAVQLLLNGKEREITVEEGKFLGKTKDGVTLITSKAPEEFADEEPTGGSTAIQWLRDGVILHSINLPVDPTQMVPLADGRIVLGDGKGNLTWIRDGKITRTMRIPYPVDSHDSFNGFFTRMGVSKDGVTVIIAGQFKGSTDTKDSRLSILAVRNGKIIRRVMPDLLVESWVEAEKGKIMIQGRRGEDEGAQIQWIDLNF